MPQLDATREEIAYLKLWLGIVVATGISVFAWLVSNFRSAQLLLRIGAVIAFLGFAVGATELHRRIRSNIDELRRL